MRRARKRSLIAAGGAVLLATVAAGRPVEAFHSGATFNAPPGAGGAGGLFFTGAPRERGWDCGSCHVEPPHLLRLYAESDPPELFRDGRYTPGASYSLVIEMVEERRGLTRGDENYNGMALTVVDETGRATGSLFGLGPDFFARGSNIAASESGAGQTRWELRWRAPERGEAHFHVAAVDGDGGELEGGPSDPFGDDVVSVTIVARPL